ncbi:MAG: hypothetical protein QXF58_06245 [Desulfurococcaceae archaeon]
MREIVDRLFKAAEKLKEERKKLKDAVVEIEDILNGVGVPDDLYIEDAEPFYADEERDFVLAYNCGYICVAVTSVDGLYYKQLRDLGAGEMIALIESNRLVCFLEKVAGELEEEQKDNAETLKKLEKIIAAMKEVEE